MSSDGPGNLFLEFLHVARSNSERCAVAAGPARLSYADLIGLADDLCARLRNAGVGCGDRVGIILPNGAEFVIATLAIWKTGGIVTPLDVSYRFDELAKYIADCNVNVVLSETGRADVVKALQGGQFVRCALVHSGDGDWLQLPEGFEPQEAADPSATPSAALTQYSTGSTGRLKRVTRSHQQLLDELRAIISILKITPDDRVMAAAPLCHSYGFINALLASLLSGAGLFTVKTFFVRDVVRLIEKEQITHFPGVPFMYEQLAEFHGDADLSSIRCARSTGAPLTERVAASFTKRYGILIRQQYGSTETGMISIAPEGRADQPASGVGCAIPGVTLHILDEAGKPAPAGAVGSIAVRSAYAARSYDGDVSGSDSYFEGAFFYPGDLGRLDAAGRLELIGRKRGFINIAGRKVDPSEVEILLRSHPAVSDAAVVGVSEAGCGRVKAVLVLSRPATEKEIFEYCRSRIAEFKCPRTIEFRDEIPRSSMGKVLRKDLLAGL